MNMIRKQYFMIIATLLSILILALFPKLAGASYDGGSLFEDSVFLGYSSMNANDIQSFLTNMGSGLANRRFLFDCAATGSSNIYYQNAGAPCGQTVLASQIIYYASVIYNINPQVVLAMLQKEQSLITTTDLTDWQINQAMGYGCPDSNGCGASNFLYQIDEGVFIMRYHYERANHNMTWWRQSTSWDCGSEKSYYKPNLYPSQNVNFYDDSGTYYRTHYIANAATSSLYCYTPHAYNNPSGLYGLPAFGTTGQYYSGSYNLVTNFERWFGSTQGIADGRLVKPNISGSGIYLIENGLKRPFPDSRTFNSYGFDWSSIIAVNPTSLNQLAEGQAMPSFNVNNRNGQLIKQVNTPLAPIYIVENGTKRIFPNVESFYSYNHTWSDVAAISATEFRMIPDGNDMLAFNANNRNGQLIKLNQSGAGVYLVEAGKKRPFPSADVFYSYGYTWSNVNVISYKEMNLIPDGSSVKFDANNRNGQLIKLNQSGAGVYLVEAGKKRPFPSADVFYSYGYTWSNVSAISNDEMNSIPNGESITINSPRLEGKPVKASYPGAGIYLIEAGKKRPFPSADVFYKHFNWDNVITISTDELNSFPVGEDMALETVIIEGKPVKIAGTGAGIYFIETGKKRPFPTAEIFYKHFNWDNVITISTDELNSFPVGEDMR